MIWSPTTNLDTNPRLVKPSRGLNRMLPIQTEHSLEMRTKPNLLAHRRRQRYWPGVKHVFLWSLWLENGIYKTAQAFESRKSHWSGTPDNRQQINQTIQQLPSPLRIEVFIFSEHFLFVILVCPIFKPTNIFTMCNITRTVCPYSGTVTSVTGSRCNMRDIKWVSPKALFLFLRLTSVLV